MTTTLERLCSTTDEPKWTRVTQQTRPYRPPSTHRPVEPIFFPAGSV
jgi:hypothetical protein